MYPTLTLPANGEGTGVAMLNLLLLVSDSPQQNALFKPCRSSPPFAVGRRKSYKVVGVGKAGAHSGAPLRCRLPNGELASQRVSRRDNPMWLSATNNTAILWRFQQLLITVLPLTVCGGDTEGVTTTVKLLRGRSFTAIRLIMVI